MPNSPKPAPGQVAWIDLTVPNAEAVRDFYQQVTGWTASSVDMGGYADYCMSSAAGNMVAGICHARYCVIQDPAGALAALCEAKA